MYNTMWMLRGSNGYWLLAIGYYWLLQLFTNWSQLLPRSQSLCSQTMDFWKKSKICMEEIQLWIFRQMTKSKNFEKHLWILLILGHNSNCLWIVCPSKLEQVWKSSPGKECSGLWWKTIMSLIESPSLNNLPKPKRVRATTGGKYKILCFSLTKTT